MSDSARKLADWCDEVEREHPLDKWRHAECLRCKTIWPCHAIRGARAVRAVVDLSDEVRVFRQLDAMVAALEGE